MEPRSLFQQASPGNQPLAERVRPEQLSQLRGQSKLLGPGSPLVRMIDSDTLSSFILWGPPGTGKTTIARIVEKQTNLHFHSFSAVFSKIAEVRELMQKSDSNFRQTGAKSIVFIDEIHRFNKSQQDAFLPFVESGAIILIGATTENPSFEVIPALLSRCHIFVLEPLSETSLAEILQLALSATAKRQTCDEEVFLFLAQKAGGDARKALGDLELICNQADSGEHIGLAQVQESLTRRSLFYDKRGEEHFNLISAFQKSIRGSDPQAALYWLARMLEAGEDPMYLVRRLVRIASEDIGLADPQALVQATAVQQAVHLLGMPEANTALAQAVVYLATAPKSNALETAYLEAREDALASGHLKVPLHIRNAPTKLMAELGYNQGYRYSHSYENAYSYQKYFPDEMTEKSYYRPSPFGFEKDIAKRLEWWQGLKQRQLKKESNE